MYSLGINLSHDRASCLIGEDNRIIAIAEERLDRIKHSCPNDILGRWFTMVPAQSVRYCLDAFNITLQELDVVVFCNAAVVGGTIIRNLIVADCVPQLPWSMSSRMFTMNHHLAHAYSTFYLSGFDEAAVVVVDKGGSVIDYNKKQDGSAVPLLERASIYHGVNGQLEPVLKIEDRPGELFWNCNSVGALYELITLNLGYTPFDAGKTMGLAPYGSLDYVPEIRRHYELTSDGYQISPTIQTVGAQLFPTFFARHFGPPNSDPQNPPSMQTAIARAGQVAVEDIMVHLAQLAMDKTGSRKLCIAGGVGLNCVANSRIRQQLNPEAMFIQPAASDDGTAIGAAIYGWELLTGTPFRFEQRSASLGRSYSDDEIAAAVYAVPMFAERYVAQSHADLSMFARLIADGYVVGWFEGGSEFGPRALGHRSILADPRRISMRSHLNNEVKHREPYRPYGASVLLSKASKYFDLKSEEPFMLFACEVLPQWRSELPSINHVDNTCRIQTVRQDVQPGYYELLECFESLTGLPIVLNTSFNGKGEPIVETPRDAIDATLGMNLDALYLEGHVFVKRGILTAQTGGI